MKLKGIVLAVILSLASIMMPFTVYADTLTTNNIEGINTILLSKTQNQTNTNSYWYIYEHTITLDANYVGTINLNINLTYYNPSGSSDTYGVATISNKSFYVNGNTIKVNQMVVSDNYANQGPIASSSYLLNSSNVIKYDDIDSLEQIINLLTDIYASTDDIEGLSTNQLTELQKIVTNTSLANQYLNVISQMKQWHMPIESYAAVSSAIMNNLVLIGDSFKYQYFDYPVYRVSNGDIVIGLYGGQNDEYTWIFYSTLNFNVNSIKNYFSFNSDVNIIEVTNLNRMLIYFTYGNGGLYRVKFKPITNAHIDISYLYSNQGRYVPIYIGLSSASNISTDFALQFGLSNQLLDDLHIIAQGTNQSNSAASDLESGNDQMADDMDDLATIENGYNQQFNNQLQQIDFTSPLQSNTGILPAANFVITIFNGLINNNPFSVLIIIVCILLIGKKVIGK